MSHLRGPDRHEVQLLPACVEDYVPAEAPVRFIDAFIEQLDLSQLGFQRTQPADTGRPGYHPADMLKLYVYGYVHRIRSSRRLEAESVRNLELIWLLRGLRPDFKTIADFRKDNKAAFKPVLRQFNLLCRRMDLFGAELVAIDGSKFKAVNSSRRNYTAAQLSELVKKIEERIEHYLQELDGQDKEAEGTPASTKNHSVKEKIEQLRQRKGDYEGLLTDLAHSKEKQISVVDSDARKMKGSRGYVVGYNVQVAVDAKHHLVAAEDVVQDVTDRAQLEPMATAAKTELGVDQLKSTADKGYHQADQLRMAQDNGIEAYVPEPKANSGHAVFPKDHFKYDAQKDVYQCPSGQVLTFQGKDQNHGKVRLRYFNRQACTKCPLRAQCTGSGYRLICRGSHEAAVERTRERVAARSDLVKRRKEIVEHVFGTLRNWNHDTFLMRGLQKVRAEFSLSALAYNIRRALSVLGAQKLIQGCSNGRYSVPVS